MTKNNLDLGHKIFRRNIKWIHRTNKKIMIRGDGGTFYQVNPSGFSIIESCDGVNCVNDILDQLKLKYDGFDEDDGRRFLENLKKLGFIKEVSYPYNRFWEAISKDDYSQILSKVSKYLDKEGPPKPEHGQYYATPQTALHRALLLKLEGDLDNQDILFIGDDDLNSVAFGLIGGARSMTVLDIDENVLSTVAKASKEYSFEINTVLHDLRKPLPDNLLNSFDVVVTDSYWDAYGILFFIIQGTEFLRSEKGKKVYFSLGYPFFEAYPEYFHETFPQGYVLSYLDGMRLNKYFIGYNEYTGSTEYAFLLMHSHLYVLESDKDHFGPKLKINMA